MKFKYFKAAFSVVILSASCLVNVANAGLIQWNTGVGSNNHWYETVITENGGSWQEAQTAATLKGGYLVTIRSQEENEFISDNSLISNPETSNGSLQGSFWTGGVANIIDENSLTPNIPTTWHWANGESWDYANFGGGDADGLDAKATGNIVVDNITFPIPTYTAEIIYELASYIRIGKYPDNNGGWSDQPENGYLDRMGVDFVTGDITSPLESINYMYGYVIEFDSKPENVPEPSTLVIFALGITGLAARRHKKQS